MLIFCAGGAKWVVQLKKPGLAATNTTRILADPVPESSESVHRLQHLLRKCAVAKVSQHLRIQQVALPGTGVYTGSGAPTVIAPVALAKS